PRTTPLRVPDSRTWSAEFATGETEPGQKLVHHGPKQRLVVGDRRSHVSEDLQTHRTVDLPPTVEEHHDDPGREFGLTDGLAVVGHLFEQVHRHAALGRDGKPLSPPRLEHQRSPAAPSSPWRARPAPDPLQGSAHRTADRTRRRARPTTPGRHTSPPAAAQPNRVGAGAPPPT